MKLLQVISIGAIIFGIVFFTLIKANFFVHSPEFYSTQISGGDVLECGNIPICGDRTVANKCVLDAFQTNRSFSVWFYLSSIDSKLAVGYASNKKGEVYRLFYDSDPTGGMGLWSNAQHALCKSPKIIDFDGDIQLICEENAISPGLERVGCE